MQASDDNSHSPRWGLVIGHPGHELRVWAWMRTAKPIVAILTDGSGHGGHARLDLSLGTVCAAKAIPSNWFGVATDQEIYQAIVGGNNGFFLRMSDVLAETLMFWGIEQVAGDAIEGYNPTHDLCRLMLDRAIRIIEAKQKSAIINYEFKLSSHPSADFGTANALSMELSPSELAQKLADIKGYAAVAGGTLLAEVEQMAEAYGEASFGREYLTPADAESQLARLEQEKPFYETYGEKRVASGHYELVIRYARHIAPIARALKT